MFNISGFNLLNSCKTPPTKCFVKYFENYYSNYWYIDCTYQRDIRSFLFKIEPHWSQGASFFSVGFQLRCTICNSVHPGLNIYLLFEWRIQGVPARAFCRQNESNFALDWLALTSIFGLCFMPVSIIKSNCYSLIYSSLGALYSFLLFIV